MAGFIACMKVGRKDLKVSAACMATSSSCAAASASGDGVDGGDFAGAAATSIIVRPNEAARTRNRVERRIDSSLGCQDATRIHVIAHRARPKCDNRSLVAADRAVA